MRYEPGGNAYLVALNVGKNSSVDDYHGVLLEPTYKEMGKIVLNSGNIEGKNLDIGKIVDLNEITLKPAEGIVIEIYRKDRQKDEL